MAREKPDTATHTTNTAQSAPNMPSMHCHPLGLPLVPLESKRVAESEGEMLCHSQNHAPVGKATGMLLSRLSLSTPSSTQAPMGASHKRRNRSTCMSHNAHSAAALPQAPHVGPAAAPRLHALPHSSQKQSSVVFSSPHPNVHQMNCTGVSTLARPKRQPPESG